jgi:hypothetical protein
VAVDVDFAWILDLARAVGDADPAPEDFGVPIGAVARQRAVLMGQDVYVGTYPRAAALTHSLGRLPWLERSNSAVALGAGVGYLLASGIRVRPTAAEVRTLTAGLADPTCTVHQVLTQLKSWPT